MEGTIVHLGKFYPPHRGGIETHVQELVRGMSSSNSIRVIVAGSTVRGCTEHLDRATVVRVPTLGVLASMPVTPTLPWALLKAKPAILHVQAPNPGAALAICASNYHGPLVITHQSDTLGRRFLKKISNVFVLEMMKRADRIVVTSQRYLDSSEELVQFRSKCRVIPMGITIDENLKTLEIEIDGGNLEKRSGVILAVGRLVDYKGFIYLVEAMREIEATLVLIGTGPLDSKLRKAAQDFDVSHKIQFLGKVDKLSTYYEASSVFVLPSISRAEAFGLVQLEAMAAGVPVVNTDLESGVPEVSVHGITGITVPPNNSHALAQAINTLLDDPELRKKMSEAGKVRARREFSAKVMITRMMSLYEEVLRERGRARS